MYRKNHVPIKRIKSQNRYSLTRDWSGDTHIKQLFGAEKSAKVKGLAKLKQRLYKRFGKQIIASKECLAKQLERGASKLRA